jgi:branched-subunit amino acid ABC-type transport system permease component
MVLAQILWDGLIYGALLALGAISFALLEDVMDFVNFAHGVYLALGAYIAVTFNSFALSLPLWLSFLLVLPISVVVILVVDWLVYRPIRDRDSFTYLLTSVGVTFIFRNIFTLIYGTGTKSYTYPFLEGIQIAGVTITQVDLLMLAGVVLLMIGFYYVYNRTLIGKSMRAMSDNKTLAAASGIHNERVITWTWVIVSVGTGAAGAMLGLQLAIQPLMGFKILLPVIAAVILAGMGEIYPAAIGGLILGLLQKLAVPYVGPSYQVPVAFIVMVLILFVKPEGIFGTSSSNVSIKERIGGIYERLENIGQVAR